jgi:hypothetical protein
MDPIVAAEWVRRCSAGVQSGIAEPPAARGEVGAGPPSGAPLPLGVTLVEAVQRAACGLMVAMVEPSGSVEPGSTSWAYVPTMVREAVHEIRHPTPIPVRYLRCDGCGHVTPQSTNQRIYTSRLPSAR